MLLITELFDCILNSLGIWLEKLCLRKFQRIHINMQITPNLTNPKLHNKYSSTYSQHDTMQFGKMSPTLHSIKALQDLNIHNINAKPQPFSWK